MTLRDSLHRLMHLSIAFAVVFALNFAGASFAQAPVIGVVSDFGANSVHVLDLETSTLLGSVSIPGPRDCEVSPDSKSAYVSSTDTSIWVIDLTAVPPVLANGPNPIPTSTKHGADIDLSPDGRFLIATSEVDYMDVMSVIDVHARLEVDTYDTGRPETASDIHANGQVAVITESVLGFNLYLLDLDSQGQLTDTGLSTFSFFSFKDPCYAPDGESIVTLMGFLIEAHAYGSDDLSKLDQVSLGATFCPSPAQGTVSGLTGCLNPSGTRFYSRSGGGATSTVVESIAYDSATRSFGPAIDFTICSLAPMRWTGVEQIAVDEVANRLYIVDPTAIEVHDAQTGAHLESITSPAFVDLLGMGMTPRTPAQSVERQGNGSNPVCLTDAGPPVLGSTWIASVDGTVVTSPIVTFLYGRDAALNPGIQIGAGEILIDIITGELLLERSVFSGGGIDDFPVVIPNNVSLNGLRVFTQSVVLGAGNVALCNGLDLTVGFADL